MADIAENPYMQYLIGLHEFTSTPPFSQSSISNFRVYLTSEMINEINEYMFETPKEEMENEAENEAEKDKENDSDDDSN